MSLRQTMFFGWCVAGNARTLIMIDARIAADIAIRVWGEGWVLIWSGWVGVRGRLLRHCAGESSESETCRAWGSKEDNKEADSVPSRANLSAHEGHRELKVASGWRGGKKARRRPGRVMVMVKRSRSESESHQSERASQHLALFGSWSAHHSDVVRKCGEGEVRPRPLPFGHATHIIRTHATSRHTTAANNTAQDYTDSTQSVPSHFHRTVLSPSYLPL